MIMDKLVRAMPDKIIIVMAMRAFSFEDFLCFLITLYSLFWIARNFCSGRVIVSKLDAHRGHHDHKDANPVPSALVWALKPRT